MSSDLVQESEYGTWTSPISSKLATGNAIKFQDLCVDSSPGCQGLVHVYVVHVLYVHRICYYISSTLASSSNTV